MGRRVYVKGKKTYAKGQTDQIEGNRYFNTISLMSIKVDDANEINPLDRVGEFYFEIGGEGVFKTKMRVPYQGEIYIPEKVTFTPKQDFTLFNEFVESKEGSKTDDVRIRLLEKDASRDDVIIDSKVGLVYGSGAKYEVLRGKGVKLKIKISSSKTRF
ncbi:MAG: hypothetical protein ACFFD4_03600 [Candidatus Odinarchaeota archaeon]